jgi:hypothetical protein
MQTVAAVSNGPGNCSDEVYNAYLARFAQRFSDAMGSGKPLFTTNAEDLFSAYLSGFPDEAQRQYHNCSDCRHFINRIGGLVMIDADGMTATPFWFAEDAPEYYRASIEAIAKAVRRAKVTGVFLSSDKRWGVPVTGKWTHLCVTPPAAMVFKHKLLTANQAMAEKREDFITLSRALTEFNVGQLDQALSLLNAEALYRSEKVRGPIQWLRDLAVERDKHSDFRKSNVTWLAVATAPPGFCHPRSSMSGSLLEDIAAGMDFADASRRFAAKMHPLQYQRPQAAPNAQNIKRGEEIIAAMGAQRSLVRRFARLDEIETVWRPAAPKADTPAKGGVFGHLKAKGEAEAPSMTAPASAMTWDKFQRTVLPTAETIEFYAPSGRANYTALVTAVDPEAPPILQWDMPERRNPVSWYVWHGGSTPESFSLQSNAWHKVNAIALNPAMWHDAKASHHGKGLVLILDGARETKQSGNALFPECLKSELHAVRATIEAYSKAAELEGMAEGDACGLALNSGGSWNALVRVRNGGQVTQYRLDRWD